MPVYLIRAADSGMVKIGYATDPEARLADLQGAHYEELRIIRLIDGELPVERWMHRRFAAQRGLREWFRFVPEMLTVAAPRIVATRDAGMELIRQRRGLLAEIARQLGISRAAVAVWDRVPAERLPEIERITGIPREELRPDICPKRQQEDAA